MKHSLNIPTHPKRVNINTSQNSVAVALVWLERSHHIEPPVHNKEHLSKINLNTCRVSFPRDRMTFTN